MAQVSDWKAKINEFAFRSENEFDALRWRFHTAMGGLGPVIIQAYTGYGTAERMYLKGRVLEDRHIQEATDRDKIWNNLVNMYKRADSHEVPHAQVAVRFQGQAQTVTADEEGFFEAWITPTQPLPTGKVWHEVELELIAPLPEHQPKPIRTMGTVFVPLPSAQFVVISDIDDTVLRTDMAHLLHMARSVFLGNARTRLPFPGVAALYRALFAGAGGQEYNPLFYVSSSPWNLYDLLAQFFHLHHIPVGPVLFLRDWGLTEHEMLPVHNKNYKLKVIQQMLAFYPRLPFILLGDSGQEDPEIYTQIVDENPRRVLAVYIRNVSKDGTRPEAIRALAKKVIETGSALVLADDSYDIGKHAAEHGYLNPAALEDIHQDKEKDETPDSLLDGLVEPAAPAKEAPPVVVEDKTAENKPTPGKISPGADTPPPPSGPEHGSPAGPPTDPADESDESAEKKKGKAEADGKGA